MPKCCVRGCGSNYSKKAPLISLHKLPRNDKLKSKWLESLGQENIDSSQENVCSLHFEESCINRSLDIVRLHDNAIPTRLPKTKTTRPKAVYLWTEADVQKWLRRHCSDYYTLYWERFHEHDITGRALVRINDNTLLRMGITNKEHREAIWREILKLRLKADIVEIRDLERRHNYFNYDL